LERKRGGLLCVPHNPSLSLFPILTFPSVRGLCRGFPTKKEERVGGSRKKRKQKRANKNDGGTQEEEEEKYTLFLLQCLPSFFSASFLLFSVLPPLPNLPPKSKVTFAVRAGQVLELPEEEGNLPSPREREEVPYPNTIPRCCLRGSKKGIPFLSHSPISTTRSPILSGGGAGGVCVWEKKKTLVSQPKKLSPELIRLAPE